MSDSKHVLLITAGPVGSIPGASGSGAAMGTWAIAKLIREQGHAVSVCHIPLPNYTPTDKESNDKAKRLAALHDLGVPIDIAPSLKLRSAAGIAHALTTLRSAIRPRVEDFYPYAYATSFVRRVIEARKPDSIYHMHTNTLVTTDGYCKAARLVMTGDLDDLTIYHRWKLTPLSSFPKYVYYGLRWMAARKLRPALIPMLKTCQRVISVAYHVIEDFRKDGIDCQYVPNPWATNAPPPLCLTAKPLVAGGSRKPRAIMLGHLQGTPTASGLYFLVNETLSHLDRILGRDKYEIHIIGSDSPPKNLVKKLRHPAIRLRGYVDDILKEYTDAEILLVPTPIVFGARTRIAEGFSMGACVVAHQANAPGMPEMIHEKNILLGKDGKHLAEMIARAFGDPALRRRIGEDARKTWETYYAPDKAIAQIAFEMIRIAGGSVVGPKQQPVVQTVRG